MFFRLLCSTLIPLIVFIGGQLADGITTVNAPPNAREANIFVQPFAHSRTSMFVAGAAFDAVLFTSENLMKMNCSTKNGIHYALGIAHGIAANSNAHLPRQPYAGIQVRF